jgi:rubrerythrin
MMSQQVTVDQLFELAIALERAAEALYQGMATRFAHAPDVARFWQQYAAEESTHARGLAHIQAELSPEHLSETADAEMVEQARRRLKVSVGTQLNQVRNLEDAYQLANELESTETNAVFEFLIEHFSATQEAQSFVRAQLENHIGKLMTEFPEPYRRSRASRLRLKAVQDN